MEAKDIIKRRDEFERNKEKHVLRQSWESKKKEEDKEAKRIKREYYLDT